MTASTFTIYFVRMETILFKIRYLLISTEMQRITDIFKKSWILHKRLLSWTFLRNRGRSFQIEISHINGICVKPKTFQQFRFQ